MPKKTLINIVIVIVIALVGVLAYNFKTTLKEKVIQKQKVERLPSFELKNIDGRLITQMDIVPNSWTVFVFFNTQCHYCQEEAKQLVDLNAKVKETQFLWVSSEKLNDIKNFIDSYGLSSLSNVITLHDLNATFSESLNVSAVPQFLVYAPNGTLAKNHKGAWRMEKLLEKIDYEFQTP